MPVPSPREQSPVPPRGFFRDAEAGRRLYLHPVDARRAGAGLAFEAVETMLRADGAAPTAIVAVDALRRLAVDEGEIVARRVAEALTALAAPRPDFAGLALDRLHIMGIVNVTPDSFTDGGAHAEPLAAIAHGRALAAAGAAIVDVGGESTRPGATPVPEDEELARVLPVIAGLGGCGAVISVDTRKAPVMRAALDAGAAIVNDVSALSYDPASLDVVAAAGAPVILTHMRGETATMNDAPFYASAPLEVYDELAARVETCLAAGIGRDRIAVDPGFGFAKSRAHNGEILDRLGLLHGLGCALVVGAAGKWFAPRGGHADAALAASLSAARQGAHILRVHDVAEMAAALGSYRLRSKRSKT